MHKTQMNKIQSPTASNRARVIVFPMLAAFLLCLMTTVASAQDKTKNKKAPYDLKTEVERLEKMVVAFRDQTSTAAKQSHQQLSRRQLEDLKFFEAEIKELKLHIRGLNKPPMSVRTKKLLDKYESVIELESRYVQALRAFGAQHRLNNSYAAIEERLLNEVKGRHRLMAEIENCRAQLGHEAKQHDKLKVAHEELKRELDHVIKSVNKDDRSMRLAIKPILDLAVKQIGQGTEAEPKRLAMKQVELALSRFPGIFDAKTQSEIIEDLTGLLKSRELGGDAKKLIDELKKLAASPSSDDDPFGPSPTDKTKPNQPSDPFAPSQTDKTKPNPPADPFGDPFADPPADPPADPFADPPADPFGDPFGN